MKHLFDEISVDCSKLVTKRYSTSFSLGIKFLDESMHKPVYSVYGFVRLADEIVDSFHEFNKEDLLEKFISDTHDAIRDKISLNPILNSFQQTVHRYNIDLKLIDSFLESMKMDLNNFEYDEKNYAKYIYGSAESVGLMCLHVFLDKNIHLYEKLKPYAMKLGAAFQKVNFLRDASNDNDVLGRTYFPGVNIREFTSADKARIEDDIQNDFREALEGIRLLPASSKFGVYIAYYYYSELFRKIKHLPPNRILKERIRIPDHIKLILLFKSSLRYQLNMI